MESKKVEVLAGTVIAMRDGQTLQVTDTSAVGKDGILYHTAYWLKELEANRAAWDGRSRFRKWLGMAPYGWHTAPTSPGLFGHPLDRLLGID